MIPRCFLAMLLRRPGGCVHSGGGTSSSTRSWQVVHMFMFGQSLTWLRLEAFVLHFVNEKFSSVDGPQTWSARFGDDPSTSSSSSLFGRSSTQLWQLEARSWQLRSHDYMALLLPVHMCPCHATVSVSLVQMHVLYALWPTMRHTSDKQVALRTFAAWCMRQLYSRSCSLRYACGKG